MAVVAGAASVEDTPPAGELSKAVVVGGTVAMSGAVVGMGGAVGGAVVVGGAGVVSGGGGGGVADGTVVVGGAIVAIWTGMVQSEPVNSGTQLIMKRAV